MQPGKEEWLASLGRMAPSDQLRETEARIKFLKDNLGQFMRAPGEPPQADDPVLLTQLLKLTRQRTHWIEMTRNRGTDKTDFHEYLNGGFDFARAEIKSAFIWFCFQREPRTANVQH